jgi:acetoin utilization protein AcuB
MLVQDIMKREVKSASSDATLAQVYELMQARRIRHVPIVDAGKLVGIVTDRDLRLATSELGKTHLMPEATVSEVMAKAVRTAHPMDPVEDAARVMRELKIGCLPVLDGETLVGIVTGIDLLDALLLLTGATKPSSRIEVEVPDQPGQLAMLTAFFGERGMNVHSLLSYPHAGKVRVVLRVGSIDARQLAEALRKDGVLVIWPPAKPWQA